MSYKPRGSGWQIDVKVGAGSNPTRAPVRERITVKGSEADAKRAEAAVRCSIIRHGKWMPPALSPAARHDKRYGTIAAALKLAWADNSARGWKQQRDGKRQFTCAQSVIAVIGPDTPCSAIDHNTFNGLIAHFRECGNTDTTILRKLQSFYRALTYAVREGWLQSRPHWDRPAVGQAREFTFTQETEEEVLGWLREVEGDKDMADLFMLGIDTGCRLGELLQLTTADTNTREKYIIARNAPSEGQTTKTGETRLVFVVNARSLTMLDERSASKQRGALLFPTLSHAKVSRRMRQARAVLGHEGNTGFTFHATRHTHRSRLAEKGVDTFALMDQAGHKTERVTRRYVKLAAVSRRRLILGE